MLTFKVMPEGIEVDLGSLKGAIKDIIGDSARVESIIEKPLAFGLKFLDLAIVMDDKVGGDTEKIEQEITALEGVSQVESTGAALL